MDNSQGLLSSVQMLRFVARGSLRLGAVVPAGMNAEGLAVLAAGVPPVPYGTPLSQAYAEGSFVRRLLGLPQAAGALHSLVGPEPTVDHHAVHIREPHGGDAQSLHADRNDSGTVRYMFKIRFNPAVRQQRLWDTSDLDDPRVAAEPPADGVPAHRPTLKGRCPHCDGRAEPA